MTRDPVEPGFYAQACRDRTHRGTWVVAMRKHNRSAFNGYRYTPSTRSEVHCGTCGARWRTAAAYVDALPDAA